jgi:hypothetical protein
MQHAKTLISNASKNTAFAKLCGRLNFIVKIQIQLSYPAFKVAYWGSYLAQLSGLLIKHPNRSCIRLIWAFVVS